MEEENPVTVSLPDVSKDPLLLAQSQEDIKKLDLFVCGSCHEVFHFIEEFQEHKSGEKCTEVSKVKSTCESEGKPQVWGFTLWKNKQCTTITENEQVPSSWELYQRWCKLPSSEKDSWINAGQTIQFCTKISTAKINEFKEEKEIEKDPLAIDDVPESNEVETKDSPTNTTDLIKKGIIKPVKLNSDVTILPSTKNGDTNRAFRTLKEHEKQEYVVEQIVSKRFNPRRKTYEYQIKWENFDSEANTWEPVANLSSCKSMVEEFEENLKKIKAEKAKLTPTGTPRGRGRGRPSNASRQSFLGDLTSGRPQRTSKQKALNQVKAWCGNISDADDGGTKRPFDDDDSDDSFEKKMKYEEFSDDSDLDVKQSYSLKKVIKSAANINNGIGKKLPQNVLIPDANGVVRINQKQLPSLSTGVYIMSKTAGIIKLDSSTSKVATSGGQTIVKVAPKIGQTQIKIVKKEGNTRIQMTPKIGTPTKSFKPIITKVRKVETPDKTDKPKVTVRSTKPDESTNTSMDADDDESDDGLEEMEFPKDLPLPAPDSPPRDFVLDPFTGKIVGQEYPEKEPLSELKTDEQGTLSSAISLENIVKLAAADITEEDLKTEPMDEIDAAAMSGGKPAGGETLLLVPNSTTGTLNATASSTTGVVATITTSQGKDQSLLNKALMNYNILHKSLTSTPASRSKPPPRILNQSLAHRPSTSVNQLVRTSSHTPSLVRTKQIAPRPRFNISSSPTKFHDHPAKNVYSKSTNVSRKIGNTTIYKNAAMGSMNPQRPQARIVQSSTNVYRVSSRKESVLNPTVHQVVTKKKPVISMPSLIGDDEPIVAVAVAAPVEPAPPAQAVEAPAEAEAEATTDLSSFTLTDNENPIFITGDDGTVYQVAGQNEQGQTILITQGSDGQQQCLLVTNEATTEEATEADVEMTEIATSDVQEPLSVKTDFDSSDQVVAQVVRAEPPSPGGTHKVVVMLPDGNLMVTQVSPEEFASLELE